LIQNNIGKIPTLVDFSIHFALSALHTNEIPIHYRFNMKQKKLNQMNRKSINTCFIAAFLLISTVATAQQNLSVKAFGVTADFWDKHDPSIYPNKLDQTGRYLFEPGIELSYEVFSSFHELFSFEFVQGGYYDAVGQLAGFSHIGVRRKFLQLYKHSMTIGFGPSFHYWQNRDNVEGYVRHESVGNQNGIEYRLAWISGELEYNYFLGKKSDISLSINNIHPNALTLAVGYTYWITRKQSKNCNCPGTGKSNYNRKRR